MIQLGKISKYIRGITFKPTDVIEPGSVDSVVCMRTKNVQADLDEDDLIAVNQRFVKRNEQYLIDGDLLVSSANSWNLVGKTCYVNALPYKATAGGFISIVRANRDKVEPRYLYYWLSSSEIQHYVRLCGRQTTNISNLDRERFLKLEVPLPPLEEQRRIAAILDKADGVRRKRKAAIALTQDLLRSTFLDMFGDPVTNPKGWDAKSIESICKVVRGSSPRPKSDPRYYNGPVPRLMVADLTRDGWFVTPSIDSLTEAGAKLSRPVPKNTVVMVVSGNVGEVAKLEIDACIHDGFIGFLELKEKIVYSDYFMLVLHFMKTTHNQRTAGAIWQNLTTDGIKKMMIPLPPLSKQLEVNQLINLYQQLNTRFDSINESTENLFNSLLQRAFRGDL